MCPVAVKDKQRREATRAGGNDIRRGTTLSEDTERAGPIRDLSTWTIERLEAFAPAQDGQELERVRVVAQSRAYWSDEPGPVRRRWATLSLRANERLRGDGPWHRARAASRDFVLRTWIIEHLGPDPVPDWNPETLAADTLAALTLDPSHARALSADWRGLPREQIGELRRHKNLTAHVGRLVDVLRPGPTKDRLLAWIAVRDFLP
jgi:hypothetical protein